MAAAVTSADRLMAPHPIAQLPHIFEVLHSAQAHVRMSLPDRS